ncbi:MAG: hypothetical protein VW257_08400, partial [Quisquiliibacterium sp.]
LSRVAVPVPPIAAAAAGALVAGLALGDPGQTVQLAWRLAAFVILLTAVLVILQYSVPQDRRAAGCRAGLFDCSLPAWPSGAWREVQ